jgi:predicted dehydrogenase
VIARGAAHRRLRRPQLGFVGLGWIGLHRMQAIVESGAADCVAIADPDPGALERARTVAPDAQVAAGFEALLERELDGVVIATPSALHAEQAARALERGFAVFCQKPLGRSADEVRSVLARAMQRDRLLGVDLSYRYTDAAVQLRRLVQSRELGDVYAVNLLFHNAYGPDKPWFYDARQAGGGALLDLGTHLIDLALFILDYPEVCSVASQLFVQGRPLRDRALDVEDYAVAQLALDTGVALSVSCSWRLHAGCDCEIEASFYGPKGGAQLRNVAGSFYDFRSDALVGTARRSLSEPPDDWGGRAAVAWAAQLARSSRFDPEAKRLLAVAEVLDSIYLGARREPTVEAEPTCAS